MNTPSDSYEAFDILVHELADEPTSAPFEDMAIPQRNALLDAIDGHLQTLELRAEERRSCTWAIPAHVRKDLL